MSLNKETLETFVDLAGKIGTVANEITEVRKEVDDISNSVNEIEKMVHTKVLDRLFIQDGYLNVTFATGATLNLGKVEGKDGEPGVAPSLETVVEALLTKVELPKGDPGEPGIAPTLDEVVDALLPKIKLPKGPKGDPGVTPNIDEIIDAVLAKIEPPKDGNPGKDGEPGQPGDSPNIDEIVDLVRKLIPVPENGKPGEKGEPGKDAPFSTHLKTVDIVATTNQDNPGKQIFELPVHNFATITVDIIGAGATSFFSTKKSASFKKDQKVTEDQIERATKRSNPIFDVELFKTAGGCGIVVKGSDKEEMQWVGTVVINEII